MITPFYVWFAAFVFTVFFQQFLVNKWATNIVNDWDLNMNIVVKGQNNDHQIYCDHTSYHKDHFHITNFPFEANQKEFLVQLGLVVASRRNSAVEL